MLRQKSDFFQRFKFSDIHQELPRFNKSEHLPDNWKGNALDILLHATIPAEDKMRIATSFTISSGLYNVKSSESILNSQYLEDFMHRTCQEAIYCVLIQKLKEEKNWLKKVKIFFSMENYELRLLLRSSFPLVKEDENLKKMLNRSIEIMHEKRIKAHNKSSDSIEEMERIVAYCAKTVIESNYGDAQISAACLSRTIFPVVNFERQVHILTNILK